MTASGLHQQDAIEAAHGWLRAPELRLVKGADRVVERGKHRACHGANEWPRIYRSVYSSGSPHSIQDARPPDEDPSWKPSAPMMILMGEDDDWAPVPPCHDLPARYPNAITFVAYPARNHDFDAPGATGKS